MSNREESIGIKPKHTDETQIYYSSKHLLEYLKALFGRLGKVRRYLFSLNDKEISDTDELLPSLGDIFFLIHKLYFGRVFNKRTLGPS